MTNRLKGRDSMRYVKLEQFFMDILCCPICKTSLELAKNQATCKKCGSNYLNRNGIWDFRIISPDYCLPPDLKEWRRVQDNYESLPARLAKLTDEEQEKIYCSLRLKSERTQMTIRVKPTHWQLYKRLIVLEVDRPVRTYLKTL